MKRISKTLLAAGMSCFLLQGCTGLGTISREDKLAQGAIAGAIVGGALGYEVFGSGSGQLLGLAIGAAAGSGAGYVLADRLTQLDLRSMNKSTYEGLTSRPAKPLPGTIRIPATAVKSPRCGPSCRTTANSAATIAAP